MVCAWRSACMPLAPGHMLPMQLVVEMQVHTVGVGVAIGQACMLLAAGHKGKRFMLPHATGARRHFR